MAKIIIVTGTAGVGKTVLARRIANMTASRFLNVGELVRQEGVYSRFDRSTRSYVIDERRVHERLKNYFADHEEERLVIETHFLSGVLPKTRGMVAIVLRLDPVVLARRLKARNWPKQRIWENVESEIVDVCLGDSLRFLGAKRVYELETTGKSPRALGKEALKMISSNEGWNGRTPNWLERYDPIELSRKIL